jgi:osomolarity two-component system response regulator SKN7
MLQKLISAQKTVLGHDKVIRQLVNHLLSVDTHQRSESRAVVASCGQGKSGSDTNREPPGDVPSSSLQHALKLLNDMNTEVRFNTTGPESVGVLEPAPVGSASALKAGPRSGVVQPPTATDANPANLLYPKEDGETEPVACSIGTTVGISAVHSAHMNNASYPNSSEQELGCTCGQVPDKRIKSGNIDPGWVRSPRILLVEDDATCRQIGSKFLHSFSCVIDTAVSPISPVGRMRNN